MAFLPVFKVPLAPIGPGPLALVQVAAQVTLGLELQTEVCEDFTITEKAPILQGHSVRIFTVRGL